jgi:hypothetical protein
VIAARLNENRQAAIPGGFQNILYDNSNTPTGSGKSRTRHGRTRTCARTPYIIGLALLHNVKAQPAHERSAAPATFSA